MLATYVNTLNALNITYTASYTQHPTYLDHYRDLDYYGPLPEGNVQVGIAQYGSRLVPRATFEGNTTALVATSRTVLELGANAVTFVAADVSRFASDEKNAVVPAWRADGGPVYHAIPTTPWSFDPADWDQMLAYQTLMTETLVPAFEAITPGSGVYMNEGDFRQRNFQVAFFGDKYERLLGIKRRRDPDSFFYATKGVGSEVWTVTEDGHMCKSGTVPQQFDR